ncbi:MAG: succinylglutamate desuccinylase/aspartoacylase family protein [Methanobrevibacter sp.]|uniref:succinylglutamate desuccinylase/aspartoacylase domain-containing protein n=1 Tax=Methanobrevibacter sp. TaxID=66852 RepID=UPI0025E9AB61|nr:succinylglutamate desuccinylase/aspartoacylase family protein [Methanobrevibacter sp.]MBQ6139507.1 succinylglutamate desuccinylase/aspartoacylase family protein [Methanobrevibacter sp.]
MMKRRFLALVLLAISLFLLLSAVSAEDIVADVNINPDNPLEAIENSNDNYQDYDSDASNATGDVTSGDSSKVPSKFTSSKNISSTYGKKVKFSLKVLNNEGKAINHTLVTFKVSGKTYNVYTDQSGISFIYLNLNAGKYTIKYNASGISGTNTYSVKNYYKITLYKWKSGANVLKNKRIKANVPNSTLVKKIIRLAKSGTPVIKFKGGNGKAVFITAGCHGNELPSQVAAMRLIKYLETHSIKGTVYVMPFMNPKGTAANVRDYKGVHLNKLAHKKGTISYKTVQLIKKFKCDAYGDFHSTRPGGKPGKDLVFGSYKPTKNSAVIAKYIAKNANVKYKIYKKAGAEYPGALEDEVNLKGIPAVTCEVLSSHGKIKKGSVYKSLLMMKTLLKYHKII